MEINPKLVKLGLSGAALIAASFFMPFEGERLQENLDPIAIREICYGHITGVKINQKLSDSQCLIILGQDTQKAERGVDAALKVKVSDRTKGAYISFAYNEGIGTFARSSIARDANAGRMVESCNDIAACNKNLVGFGCGWAGGKQLPGLIARRAAEKQLCLSGV